MPARSLIKTLPATWWQRVTVLPSTMGAHGPPGMILPGRGASQSPFLSHVSRLSWLISMSQLWPGAHWLLRGLGNCS